MLSLPSCVPSMLVTAASETWLFGAVVGVGVVSDRPASTSAAGRAVVGPNSYFCCSKVARLCSQVIFRPAASFAKGPERACMRWYASPVLALMCRAQLPHALVIACVVCDVFPLAGG